VVRTTADCVSQWNHTVNQRPVSYLDILATRMPTIATHAAVNGAALGWAETNGGGTAGPGAHDTGARDRRGGWLTSGRRETVRSDRADRCLEAAVDRRRHSGVALSP